MDDKALKQVKLFLILSKNGFSKSFNQPHSLKKLIVHTPLGELLERKESIAYNRLVLSVLRIFP